jgi:predicted transcriptional regulator YdeE
MCHCDQSQNPGPEASIIEFGPFRMIGLRYVGKNENQEIKELWNDKTGLWSHMPEIKTSPADFIVAGICRCLPDATDGSFEYFAAVSADPNAPVPSGLAETSIPADTFAVFAVDGLDKIQQGWMSALEWIKSHPEWDVYCDRDRGFCDCANHPCFERYTDEFMKTGKFYIYFPVKRMS